MCQALRQIIILYHVRFFEFCAGLYTTGPKANRIKQNDFSIDSELIGQQKEKMNCHWQIGDLDVLPNLDDIHC